MTRSKSKRKTRSDKFPLTLHKTGQYCKKIRGKLYYFGADKKAAYFEFARDMGIETIVSEPPPETLDLIEELCKEFKIKLAIHNHPKPSHYWDPDTVLDVCKDRSEWIGVCADTGHWIRSGIEPLAAIRKLRGRIISFHLKDVGEFGKREAHDIVWGTGKGNIRGILTELHRQSFKGLFAIEYEHHWEDSVPEIGQCIRYFNTIAGELKAAGR